MKIDPSKKYKTTSGAKVIIHAVDGPDPQYPIIASTRYDDDDPWEVDSWNVSGFVEDLEPREWNAIVLRDGTLAMYGEGDETRKGVEVVRVREIIEP